MLTIRDKKTTPRERAWVFPGLNGSTVSSNSHMNLMREIVHHYRANGQPVPDEETITKYLCDNLTIPCFDDGKPYRNQHTDTPTFAKRGKPSPDWGFLLNPLKLVAKEGDKGLGSIVERVVGPIGGSAFKIWFRRIFGRDCGCKERKEDWDLTYPL